MQAGQLINYAWYLSGIVARDLDDVQGSQGRDGLFWMNQIISEMSVTGRHIPFYQHVSINMVAGQEKYVFDKLVSLDVATFNIQSVRYAMTPMDRDRYWGQPRIDNVDALPFSYYFERENDSGAVYVYWKPQSSTYVLNITGLFGLDDVIESTQLDDFFDKFYQTFLMYKLAEQLCDWYKVTMPPATMQKLMELSSKLLDLNPLDLTANKIPMSSYGNGMTYAQANYGRGWTGIGYGGRS